MNPLRGFLVPLVQVSPCSMATPVSLPRVFHCLNSSPPLSLSSPGTHFHLLLHRPAQDVRAPRTQHADWGALVVSGSHGSRPLLRLALDSDRHHVGHLRGKVRAVKENGGETQELDWS